MRTHVRTLGSAATLVLLLAVTAAPPMAAAQQEDPSEYDLEAAPASASFDAYCPAGEAPGKPFYRKLTANNYWDSFANDSNGMSVPRGTYIIRIVKGAWSPYASGAYWRVSATVHYTQDGRMLTEPLFDPVTTFATPKRARKSMKGFDTNYIRVGAASPEHPKNLFLFIADFYPFDNRGFEIVELTRCVRK